MMTNSLVKLQMKIIKQIIGINDRQWPHYTDTVASWILYVTRNFTSRDLLLQMNIPGEVCRLQSLSKNDGCNIVKDNLGYQLYGTN
jgi:hypothetical protein